MTHNIDLANWKPIEGSLRQKRSGPKTFFGKKRADHRNVILKDWGKRLEINIEPVVPSDYVSPFDPNKCIYCLSLSIGRSGDEFRPLSQRGRYNKVNCVPCCGPCNSSKQAKCGTDLINWITEENPKKRSSINIEQQQKIINWYKDNEQFLIIPLDTIDTKDNISYEDKLKELDNKLNKIYEDLS